MSRVNPYSPPKSGVEDAGRQRLLEERPRQVVHATALLWTAFALDLISGYRQSQRDPDLMSPAGAVAAGTVIALAVAVNVSVWRGRNWARVVYAIVTMLAFLTLFLDTPPAGERALTLTTLLIGVVVLYLLFTTPGSLWFRYARK
jgi:hypothetical protein